MYEYDVFIDISHDWQEDNIDVVQMAIKANSTKQANEKALKGILNGKYDGLIQGRLWYLWEITEQDKVN